MGLSCQSISSHALLAHGVPPLLTFGYCLEEHQNMSLFLFKTNKKIEFKSNGSFGTSVDWIKIGFLGANFDWGL